MFIPLINQVQSSVHWWWGSADDSKSSSWKDNPRTQGLTAQFQRKENVNLLSKAFSSKESFSLCVLFLGRHRRAKLLTNRQPQLSIYSWQLRWNLHTFYDRPPPASGYKLWQLCLSPALPFPTACAATPGTEPLSWAPAEPRQPPGPTAGHIASDQTTSVELAVCFYGGYHQISYILSPLKSLGLFFF